MSRWFRMYDDLLDDPKVQRLDPVLFKAEFEKAFKGQDSAFGDYVRPGNDRPNGSEWAKLRSFVFERDGFTCCYCGAHGVRLECDHVIPVSRGGSNETENLKTACKPCNRSKRDKLVSEWMQ